MPFHLLLPLSPWFNDWSMAGKNTMVKCKHTTRWNRLARLWALSCLTLLQGTLFVQFAAASIIQVGPQRTIKMPSQAAEIANDGDLIEIDSGAYMHDTAVWRANELTIRGVGGKAHLLSYGAVAENKAIWVIKGNNTKVSNVDFSGARTIYRNGAGIRLEGNNLLVENCTFSENENGILVGPNPNSSVNIINSEFDHNGFGDGYSHNLYIGALKKLTVLNSYFHHARVGHQIKSRAAENVIKGNRIEDGPGGRSSYLIDLPSGGVAQIEDNVLHQGAETQNSTMIAYGAENIIHQNNSVEIRRNRFINDKNGDCRSVWIKPPAVPLTISDNHYTNCAGNDADLAQPSKFVPGANRSIDFSNSNGTQKQFLSDEGSK